jgi:TRAP-type C4-dicarboxylate transport system permease small subunit
MDRASLMLAWISMAALTAMMTLIGTDVFLRFLFGRSILGTVEITGNYLMVTVMALPLAYGMMKGAHIAVDIVVSKLSSRLGSAFEVLGLVLSLAIFGLITWYAGAGAWNSMKDGESMVNIGLPIWPGKAMIPLAGFFLCFQIALAIFRNLRHLLGNTANNESRE